MKQMRENRFPTHIRASLIRTTHPTQGGVTYCHMAAKDLPALPLLQLSYLATPQSLHSNAPLERAGDHDGARKGSEQTAGIQLEGKAWPSATSGDQYSVWRG